MHAPVKAHIIAQAQKYTPGVCRACCPGKERLGLYIPYRRVRCSNNHWDKREAVMIAYVCDRTSNPATVATLPFLIDTGTQLTIIPRKMLPRLAFSFRDAIQPSQIDVIGINGGRGAGEIVSANLTINSIDPACSPFIFNNVSIVIIDSTRSNYAVLGMDILSKVIVIFDTDHVALYHPEH